jgi:hypothetical protein
MSALFQPRRPDGRPEWRVIFDITHDAEPGRIFGYAELGAALETDDKPQIYRAVVRCNRELWRSQNRSLGNVRCVGYKLLLPQEHEGQALGYQGSARRKVSNAVSVMKATDLAALSNSERDRALRISALMVAMCRSIDWHAERLSRHDDLIRELADRVDKLERPD